MAPHTRRTNQSLCTRDIAGLWLTEGQSCSLPAHERQSGQTQGVKRQGTAPPNTDWKDGQLLPGKGTGSWGHGRSSPSPHKYAGMGQRQEHAWRRTPHLKKV